jgi:glycosyltransferase involved in cell wall biosynthesis
MSAVAETLPAQAAPGVELSVVMPVYNEEQALPGVLDEALAALAEADFTSEIVLVDDASTDRSREILEAYQARHPRVVRVLRHERNRGIAEACRTLYEAARGAYVFINGSDGQWRTAECLAMMARRREFDLIVGKRRLKQYTWRRRLISGAFNLLPRLLFGVATHDAGSIKLFRREVLRLPLTSRGPFREAERIVRARRRGYRVGVVEVEHLARHGGTAGGARWGLVCGALADLGRCWWSLVIRGER